MLTSTTIRTGSAVTLIALLLVAVIVVFLPTYTVSARPLSAPATFTVNTTNDTVDANIGNNICADSTGACSLRAAIQEANGNGNVADTDIIQFDAALSGATITLGGTQLPDITENLTIDGSSLTNQITISGNNASRIFTVSTVIPVGSPPTVTFDSLIITGANPELAGSTGGGIYLTLGSTLTVTNSIISANTAEYGGGIFSEMSSTLTVTNSTISGNSGEYSGGIHHQGGSTLTITNSTISGNSATGTYAYAGGITNEGVTAMVTNSTISGNSGAGVYSGGTLTVTSSTISGNTGVGIGNGGTLNMTNAIIANNGDDCSYTGTIDTNSYNLIEDGTCNTGTTFEGFVTGDPALGPLADNGGPTQTHALLTISPAIDAGNCAAGTDQRGTGFSRPVDFSVVPNASGGNGCDRGAFEYQDPGTNIAPAISANMGLTLNEGATATITSAMLKTIDLDHTAVQLTYTVTSAPTNGSLNLGSSFTQADINAGSLTYTHDGGETTSDSFGFSVSDGTAAVTGTFSITVTPVNDAPVIATNAGLTLNEGATATITNAMLRTTDVDNTTAQLSYTVTSAPANGSLNLTTFTQATINSSGLTYTHNGGETTSDSFGFSVSDGAVTLTGTFSITVTPVNDTPVIEANTGLTVNETATITITSSMLRTTDADNTNAQLAYILTSAPANGSLNLGSSFTQADINAGSLTYTHDGSGTLADSFSFSVTDGVIATPLTGTFNITVTLLNFYGCSTVITIPQAQCNALVALYNSTNGANWTNKTGWLSAPDPCNWFGVTCNANRTNVTQLQVFNNNLNGTIPSEIGSLPALTLLNLSGNDLTGAIPAAIGSLTNLTTLNLSANHLSGGVPVEIGSLSKLQILELAVNRLDGTIPAEIGNVGEENNHTIHNLRTFTVNANALQDDIPAEITNLQGLDVGSLALKDNRFTGPFSPQDPVNQFIQSKDQNWDAVQTVPPAGVGATVILPSSPFTPQGWSPIIMSWSPILYSGGVGYYEVWYGTTSGNHPNLGCRTADKTADGCPLEGLLPNTTYYFVVRTFSAAHDDQQNDLTSVDSAEVSKTTAPLPTTLSLLEPQDIITNSYGNPTYSWPDTTNAAAYDLWVGTAAGAQVVYLTNLLDATYCNSITCSVEPTTLSDANRLLFMGDYQVWLRAVNGAAVIADWAGPFTFTLAAGGVPSAPLGIGTVANQGRPTITWNDDMNAFWFQVYIGGPGGVYMQWHNKLAAGDLLTCDGTTCTLNPAFDVVAGTYDVWVQSWGVGGFGTGGAVGSWNGGISLDLTTLPAPVAPSDATATNPANLTLNWSGIPGVTWYNLWLGTPGPEWATKYFSNWTLASAFGCGNAETCTAVTEVTLAAGNYVWYMQAWGPGGFMDWTELPPFSVP